MIKGVIRMKYFETHKDITTVDRKKYVIAHCISADCAMGAGVVVPIKKTHKELKSSCMNYSLSKKGKVLGEAYRFEDEIGIVYNMFTKKNVMHKAGIGMTVEDYHNNIRKSLKDIKEQMNIHNEKFLALPLIGCGLDLCSWDDIHEIIIEIFQGSDINILICIWKPPLKLRKRFNHLIKK